SQLVAAGTLAGLPLANQIAAVSVGLVDGRALLDLDYGEDSRAQMDMNVVMDARGRLIEVQATAEQAPVERGQLDRLLDLAAAGIESLLATQRAALD
ncbi:MAG: ribonuclease PH, partial [Gemmatimonadaceae bacterium]|nr:ribonuclease PH [Gloeobacterales cyanobacterium ES-bin-141]